MDQSFAQPSRSDLSFILASPKINRDSKIKSTLDQMDQILNNMGNYNTTKIDIKQINDEAKVEAKKCFYGEIDGLKMIPNLAKIDEFDMFGFNKICAKINRGLKKEGIFENVPFLIFKKADLYNGQVFSEKVLHDILLSNTDKLKMFKTGLKMISLENNLDNITMIKKVLIDEMISVSIEDVYSTFIKILINNGISLELLKRYVIKYQNIKDNLLFQQSEHKEADSESDDLDIIQSFIHIVDLIEISINTVNILDHQILTDYVSIILILFSEQSWRFNLPCLNSLAHLFALVLNRIENSEATNQIVLKTITRFFKNKYSLFFEFIDFFPENTKNLIDLKFALCKTSLLKYQIKIGHNKGRVDLTFDRLKELKSLNCKEFKLILAFIDHFFRTRELSNELSQQISDRLVSFTRDYEFGEENQISIEFKAYVNSLIEQYDRKSTEASMKRKRIKGEHQARPRKMVINQKEIKKIWDEFESEVENLD